MNLDISPKIKEIGRYFLIILSILLVLTVPDAVINDPFQSIQSTSRIILAIAAGAYLLNEYLN